MSFFSPTLRSRMGKSLRTSLMSYTSLHLRRSRAGRGFGPPPIESSRTPAPDPIASNSSSYPGQGEIKEPSRSLRVASGMLSNTTRHHPISTPRRTVVVRRSTSHTPTTTAASGFLNGRFSSNHHPFLPYLAVRGGCKRFVEPPLLKPPVSPWGRIAHQFALLDALIPEVRRRAPRAPVGPQLHFAIYGPGHPTGCPSPIS